MPVMARKTDLRDFDYKKVAKDEAEVWWAYYNHHYLRIFLKFLHLTRSQMGLSWLQTLKASYYISWAGADYRINRGEVNEQRVIANLAKFYKVVSDRSVKPFDYRKAAKLEVAWWNVHRSSYKSNKDLERGIAEAAAVIYHVKPAALKDFAHYRAMAAVLPQHEADNDQPHPPNWQHIKGLLDKAWQSLHEATKKESSRAG